MLNRTINLYRNSFAGLSREVWLLSAVLLINRSGMMVLPFISLYLTDILTFTMLQAGIAMACFGLGSVTGTLLGGWLTDRYGFYPVQFWSLLVTGFLFGGLLFLREFIPFSIGIFILTLVADTFRPAAFTAVRAYSKPENRTRSLSLIRLAINLGVAIGPAAGGFLAAAYGYHWLFIGDGVTCIAAAFFFRAKLNPKKAPAPEEPKAAVTPRYSVWRDRNYLTFLICTLVVGIAFMQLLYTTSLVFKNLYGFTEGGIGLLFGISGFLIFLIEMPAVYLLESRVRSLTLIALGSLMIGASYLVLLVPGGWMIVAAISILLITFGEIVSFPFQSTFAVERAPEGLVGRFMGLYGMMFSIGHIVAPVLGTQMIEHFGYNALFWVLGGLCTAGGLGYLYLQTRIERGKQLKAAV